MIDKIIKDCAEKIVCLAADGLHVNDITPDIRIALDEYKKELTRKIEEVGHQQEDDTVWCNMDEVLTLIKSL